MKRSLVFFLFSFLLVLNACHIFHKDKEKTLARVHDVYLYLSDLKGVVLPGTSPTDSIVVVKNYIDNWIRKQLVLRKAKDNLSKDQLDFTRQLEDYENSLAIYAYERELIRQKLDTVVSAGEIEEYYNTHQKDFELRHNIIRMRYVKLQQGISQVNQIKRLMNSNSSKDSIRLLEMCDKIGIDYKMDDNAWVDFDELLKKVPVETYDQANFLSTHSFIEASDSAYTYLVRIVDYKMSESVSPLGFERNNIRNILLNKRKIKLIKDLQAELFQRALKNNDYEIYAKE